MSRRRGSAWWTVAVVFPLLLTACGGGGADNSSAPAAAVELREQPLVLSASNASVVAQVATGYGESALVLGQAAIDWLDELQTTGTPLIAGACGDAGSSRRVALVDANGDGLPGPGDRIEVTLTHCYVRALNDNFSGSLSLVLSTPATATGRWAGQIVLGDTFGISVGSGQGVRLGGTLRFESQVAPLALGLRVYSAATPYTADFENSGTKVHEVITALDTSKQVRRDTARATASLALRVASDLLKGAIMVATETPFDAAFDTYPSAGTVTVTGADTRRVQLHAISANFRTLEFRLDGAVLGNIEAMSAADGYLWSGTGIVPDDPQTKGYLIESALVRPFRVLTGPTTAQALAPSAPLVWQLSRPLAASTPTQATLRVNTSSTLNVPTIPVTVTVAGALLTMTPSTQLEPGVAYYLTFENAHDPTVSAADGSGDVSLPSQYTAALTLDVSTSVTSPLSIAGVPLLYGNGATATLLATAKTAAGLSVRSVRWRQVSGPTVQIAGADTLTATLSPPATPSGQAPGTAVFEVEVTASNGDKDRARAELQVVPDGQQAAVFAFRTSAALPYRLAIGQLAAQGGTSYLAKVHSDGLLDILFFGQGPRVFLRPPASLAWGTGMVWDIARFVGATDTAAKQIPEDYLSTVCDATGGRVTVADYAIDAFGATASMAMDYTLVCADGGTRQGWLRYLTAVAPPT